MDVVTRVGTKCASRGWGRRRQGRRAEVPHPHPAEEVWSSPCPLRPPPPILPKTSLGRMIHSRRNLQEHDDFQTRCSLHGHPRHQVGTVCAESRGPHSAKHTALWLRTLSSRSGRDSGLGSNFVIASAEGKREEEQTEALGEPGSSGRPRLFLKCPPGSKLCWPNALQVS